MVGPDWYRIIRVLFTSPLSIAGMIIIAAFFLIGLFAPALAPPQADPYTIPRDGFNPEPRPPGTEWRSRPPEVPGWYKLVFGRDDWIHIFGTASGQWDKISGRTKVFKPTVNDVAGDVKVGTIDAGFVWDVTVQQMQPALEAVTLPELKDAVADVGVCVLKSSEQPTAALRFARYLAARDKGQESFRKHGFVVPEGDAWALEPQLRLYAGAMLRAAVDAVRR